MRIYSHLAKNPKYNLWLIHGYAETHTCFDGVFESPIVLEANIFSIDLPGFGEAPLLSTDSEAYLDELAQVIEAEHPGLPCVVLGHSMGGMVATILVSKLKRQPKALIAIDSSFSGDLSQVPMDLPTHADTELFKANLLSGLKSRIAREPDVKRLAIQAEVSRAEGLAYWAREGMRLRLNERVVDLFLGLSCPKYYWISDKSFTIPTRKKLLELLGDSVVWLPDAGHWIMLDTPAPFWQKLRELALSLS